MPSEPAVIQLSRPEVYVNCVTFGGTDAVAAALSNNFIHIVDLEAKKSKKTLDFPQNIVGIHFDLTSSPVLRIVDDSFGIHMYDVRSGSKKKSRVNTAVENHAVTYSATSDNYIAIASSTFINADSGKKKTKKKGKRKGKKDSEDEEEEEESSSDDDEDSETDFSSAPSVVSVYDIRGGSEPLITIKDSHSGSINCLTFFRDGRHLITGGEDGLINIFDVSLSKEDDALQSSTPMESPIGKVGYLSKRLIYGITDDNKCLALSPNSPDDVDILFKKNAREDKFLIDVIKGCEEEKPIAMLESDAVGNLSLLTISADGRKSDVVEEWSGHSDLVHCAAYNKGILVTGGEDGKLVVKTVDLRPSGGEKSKKEKKKKRSEPY